MKFFKLVFISMLFLFYSNLSFNQNYNEYLEQSQSFFNNRQFDEAINLLVEWMPIVKDDLGTNDTTIYLPMVSLAAQCYHSQGKYKEVVPMMNIILEITANHYGENNHKYASYLDNLAQIYDALGKYDEAEEMYKKVLKIEKNQIGENSPEYAMYYNNLGSVYVHTGRYDEAKELFIKALEINKEQLGEFSSDYVFILGNLSQVYLVVGDYDKAELSLLKCIEINKSLLGNEHLSVARNLNMLAGVYYYSEKYDQVVPLLIQVLEISEQYYEDTHPTYLNYLNSLAVTYQTIGDYERSEVLLKKVLEKEKEVLGEDHPDYARHLNNLARLYHMMGRYEQAETIFLKVLEIDKSQIGEDHSDYAIHLNNLAIVYVAMMSYNKAEKLYLQALEIMKNQIGEDHIDFAKYLNNLSFLYLEMEEYEKALPIAKQAIDITEKTLGYNNIQYAISLNTLGLIQMELGNIQGAMEVFLKAMKVYENNSYENFPEYATLLNNMASLNMNNKSYEKAAPFFIKAYNIYNYHIKSNTYFLSENELKQFLNTFLYQLEIYNSFNLQQIRNQNPSGGFAYDIELTRKGLLLKSSLGIKNRILESEDTSLINAYYELRSLRKKIDKKTLKSPEERTKDLTDLETKANELEKTLTLKSKDYNQDQIENEIKWQEVKNNLDSGEAAIEFSSFNYYNGKTSTDTVLYCAIVLRNDDTIPHMVYLCEESELTQVIYSANATNRDINFLYGEQTLYKLIWQSIDSLLEGIQKVYFAPSGLLNSISLAAITCPDEKLLMDKYSLVQLSSTRILAMPADPVIINNAVVYGGINYDTDSLTISNIAEKYQEEKDDFVAYNRSYTGDFRGGFRYLPGSQEEVESISAKLEKKDIPYTSYSGTEAIEESFLSLSGNESPSIIHLSTHGFYFPDTVSEENRKNIMYSSTGEIRFRYNDDPLLRSGLLMAGANLTWQGKTIPENVEDGILTAKEVSNMNLINTQLVVLSACQSGLGDVKGSEGVEGLQRGFKMAGVRYIIMSLWQVPDKETTEFMKKFYDHWLGGNDIHKAFHHTQIHMKNKYKDDPFKWAGFALME